MTARPALLAALMLTGPPAWTQSAATLPPPEPASVILDATAAGDTHGGWVSRAEATVPVQGGKYEFSARGRAWRDPKAYRGTGGDVSLGVRRLLYHVSIGARLGAKTPNAEGASYRLREFETTLTFYGRTLGPERPEIGAALWEKGGPPPLASSLDRTWVTQAHALYSRADHRIDRPEGRLELAHHTTRFELRETWRERTSLALIGGWSLYDLTLEPTDASIHLLHTPYPGAAFPVRGWPNQFFGADGWVDVAGAWRLHAAGTRVQFLDGGVEALLGAGLGWRPRTWVRLSAWLHERRRRGGKVREGISLDAALLF